MAPKSSTGRGKTGTKRAKVGGKKSMKPTRNGDPNHRVNGATVAVADKHPARVRHTQQARKAAPKKPKVVPPRKGRLARVDKALCKICKSIDERLPHLNKVLIWIAHIAFFGLSIYGVWRFIVWTVSPTIL